MSGFWRPPPGGARGQMPPPAPPPRYATGNSPSEMFVNLYIRSFDEMLRMFTFGFMSRVIVFNNLLISNIYNSPCRLYSNIWS